MGRRCGPSTSALTNHAPGRQIRRATTWPEFPELAGQSFRNLHLLIRAGADRHCEDKTGVAPLHRAVRTRCTAAVRALLANGADATLRNKSGSTPLHLAVQNTGRGGSGSDASRREQAAIIRLLIRHGARASDKNAAGRSVKSAATGEWVRAVLDPPAD
jgi:hypothetical protein